MRFSFAQPSFALVATSYLYIQASVTLLIGHHAGHRRHISPTSSYALPSSALPVSAKSPAAVPSSFVAASVGDGSDQSSNSSLLASPSDNYTSVSTAPSAGEFWAGATIGCLPRLEAIPGRVFYDYDGKTVKDPVQTFGDAGLNAFRLETTRGQCLGPTQFVNNGSTLSEELLFELDWGCIDLQVKMAQRAKAAGMVRFELTINQGFNIPAELENATYAQMIDDIKAETKRQLQPFLDVQIVPDVILFENEGSDGFLFTESNGHTRGSDDGKASTEKVDQELCGQIPTGNMNSYPQYAGYLKAEINACNEAISAAGFFIDTMRYGLHSHNQYVQWKEEFVHGPNQHSQSDLLDLNEVACSGQSPIPADLLAQNVTTMLNTMGFSAYPDPLENPASYTNLVTTLTELQGYSDAWGKYTNGSLAGQYRLVSLGVEYATRYDYEQTAQEVDFTASMFKAVKQFPAFLGLLWYEAWYCYSDWEGGDAVMCHRITTDSEITGEAPTDTVKTWGAQAVSPWKLGGGRNLTSS